MKFTKSSKTFFNELNDMERFYKKGNLMQGYFYGQKYRYLENYNKIKKNLRKKDFILDVGSNPPYFLAILNRLGYNIEGIDIAPDIESKFIKKEKIIIKKCNIEKDFFPYKDYSFDKIIFSEVFEHLYLNPIHTMKEIRRVLKKDGKLILTTPNGYSLKRVGNFILGRGLSENPFREFNLRNTLGYYGHIREYSSGELKDFLKKIGFDTEETIYVSYTHIGLKKRPILKYLAKIVYFLFPKFRSHIIIVARKGRLK